jgi:hypothetical protein
MIFARHLQHLHPMRKKSAYNNAYVLIRFPKGEKYMALEDIASEELVTLRPDRLRCSCHKSRILPALPEVHCPKCHSTYTARVLGYPAYCARCGFNLRAWRNRNNIPEIDVPMR